MDLDDKEVEIVSMQPLGSPPNGEIDDADRASLVRQTRTRRLFSTTQLFALNLAFQGTWYVVALNIFYAIQNGGPRGWLFSYIVVSLGTLFQALSFAEMSSIMPIAGAQYYWTYHYAPPSLKLFLTWMQGWTTWLGYISLLASAVNNCAVTLEGLVGLGNPDYQPTGWHTTLIVIVFVAMLTVANMYFFRLVPWFEIFAGVILVLLCVVVFIMLWAFAPRNTMDYFLQTSSGSGWGEFEAFNIGQLSNIYLFIAFESTVHIGEETRNPRLSVPRGMFWGFVANDLMGLIMIFTFGLTAPSPDVILESISPLAAILHHATGSTNGSIAILAIIFFGGIAGTVGMLSSVSRLSWAWARDGGLPKYFAIVDAKTRVPERAVWGSAFLVVVLAMLNLSDQAFIALGAILSLSSLATYVSYAIVLSALIYSRVTSGIELGEWNCGRYGLTFNILGLIYTIWASIWLPFPNILPVTAENMNYSGPVYLAVIIGAITWWFLWAKKNWAGPNMKIVDLVMKRDAESI